MKFSNVLKAAAAGLLLACTAAAAQDAAAPAPAAPAGVGRPEVKTIGDWMVRCFPVTSPGPCDIYQELDDQRTRQRVLSFSIAFIPSLNRHGIQITVPLEVAIQKGLTIVTDSYTSPVLKFRYCDRTGCFVQMPMDNATIESISRSGPDAKVRIFADNGKAYDLKFSLKGFAAAHDSMAEQARAKGKAATPAAPAAPPPAQ
jgi:invasion protein IalB